MAQLMGVLHFLVSVYMLIVVIRIILTWFTGIGNSGFQNVIARITDPYLNWFRRFPALRVGFLDLSPIVALGALSLVNRIFGTLARYGTITIGIILAMVVQVLWGAVSFFLGFLIIVLILRLAAHLAKVSFNGTFWSIVDAVSQPVLFRINSILFKDRIVNLLNALIISIICLGLIHLVLGILVSLLSGTLVRLPF